MFTHIQQLQLVKISQPSIFEMVGWMTEWLIDWRNDWMNERMIDKPTYRHTSKVTNELFDMTHKTLNKRQIQIENESKEILFVSTIQLLLHIFFMFQHFYFNVSCKLQQLLKCYIYSTNTHNQTLSSVIAKLRVKEK